MTVKEMQQTLLSLTKLYVETRNALDGANEYIADVHDKWQGQRDRADKLEHELGRVTKRLNTSLKEADEKYNEAVDKLEMSQDIIETIERALEQTGFGMTKDTVAESVRDLGEKYKFAMAAQRRLEKDVNSFTLQKLRLGDYFMHDVTKLLYKLVEIDTVNKKIVLESGTYRHEVDSIDPVADGEFSEYPIDADADMGE